MNEHEDETRLARRRRLIVGSMWYAIAAVVLLTAWALAPHVWPVWKEHAIEQAIAGSTGPSFWWPESWRGEYKLRRRTLAIFELVKFDIANFDIKVLYPETSTPALVDGFVPLRSPMDPSDWPQQSSRLAVIRPVPDFTLTDQSGEPFQFSKLDGKVRLVSFVFTTCNGSCPATTHRMQQVQQELKRRGLLDDDRVRLVSITLDPTRDTTDMLRNYMRLYDADAKTWSFLTGPAADVERTIAAWDMWMKPAANGQLDHPSRIFLVDPRGRVREIYNLAFMKSDWVADDVKLLLDEPSE